MKFWIFAVLGVVLLSGGNLLAQEDFVEFQQILDSKCSQCHTRERIEQAMEKGEDLGLIIQKMLRVGVEISSREQQVLGIFWTRSQRPGPATPGKQEEDPLGEYRAILERRCTGCHSLERVEKAMQEGRSAEDLIKMMRQRGAVVTEAEQSVLGTFWGQPFKKKLPE